MSSTLSFKDILDIPEWRPLALSPQLDSAGRTIEGDLRNTEDRHPEIFHLVAATVLTAYNVKNDGWYTVGSPALAGTFTSGASAVFAPQRGPRGTLAAGCTTSRLVLGTALPAAVSLNRLADRGDGRGFRVRVISKSAGKTEERLVMGNSAGATPSVELDAPLSFTPASGDEFEFLSGRLYMLSAGTVAAGIWKFYDVLTNTFSGNLATTGLPAAIGTHSVFVCRDELYVPANRVPGEGFFGLLTATGATATTLNGQAAGGDATVVANEYRNFQIRIVADPVNKTAVGQRRKIASHTAGPSAVYTVPAWTVVPSAQAVFVIEQTNEILLWTSASTTTFTYAQDAIAGGQAADSWSTATYAARPVAPGAGVMATPSFGLAELDPGKNVRRSFVYSFRGNGTNALDILDLAGAASGVWTAGAPVGGVATTGYTFTTSTCSVYDPVTQGGCYAYISLNGTTTFLRFNVATGTLQPWAQIRYAQSTPQPGNRLGVSWMHDGNTKLGFLYALRAYGTEWFHCLLHR